MLTNSVNGYFVLVTRTNDLNEVWKDTKSGLLWGDRLLKLMSHYDANKACSAQFVEVGKIAGAWCLPTIEEYEEAESNGVRSSLPNMNYYFWSSSLEHSDAVGVWLFYGDVGYAEYYFYRYNDFSVRCVARQAW